MLRKNSKASHIYQILRQQILDGLLPAGQRLPNESEFCREFQVARETLRHALKELEDDNLILRQRSFGTFVRPRGAERPVINYLVPCPDFLSRRGVVPQFNRDLFQGVMTECYRRNAGVSTIAVSPDNNNRHIDFRQLAHLEPYSRIVVQSAWFEPVFRHLEQLHCRIVFIGGCVINPALALRPHPRPPDSAKKILFNDRLAFELAFQQLYDSGCRRIAVAAPYIEDPDSPLRRGYLDAMARYRQPQSWIFPLTEQAPRWPWLSTELARLYRTTGFDGLILCPRDNDEPDSGLYTNYTLGLPDTVKIVQCWLLPERSLRESALPAVLFDTPAIGAAAAAALLSDDFAADEILINPHCRRPPTETSCSAETRQSHPNTHAINKE